MPHLIETCRVRGGRLPLKPLHDARLSIGCRALGIAYPGPLEVPEGMADGIVRFEVSAAGVVTSLRASAEPRVAGGHDPVGLVLSDVAHRPYPHKTTDRGQFDDAMARARQREADDGLMLTLDGLVAECAISSLFWWEGEELCAPALDLGILPGVARARISQLVPLVERRVGPLVLLGRPLFVANAARGVVPVGSLDARDVGPDPRTGRLAKAFWG